MSVMLSSSDFRAARTTIRRHSRRGKSVSPGSACSTFVPFLCSPVPMRHNDLRAGVAELADAASPLEIGLGLDFERVRATGGAEPSTARLRGTMGVLDFRASGRGGTGRRGGFRSRWASGPLEVRVLSPAFPGDRPRDG